LHVLRISEPSNPNPLHVCEAHIRVHVWRHVSPGFVVNAVIRGELDGVLI